MKKLTLAIAGIAVAALVSGAALAQGRGGGGGGGGGHGGGSVAFDGRRVRVAVATKVAVATVVAAAIKVAALTGGGGTAAGLSRWRVSRRLLRRLRRRLPRRLLWRMARLRLWRLVRAERRLLFRLPGYYWGGWPYAYGAAYPAYYPYPYAVTDPVDVTVYQQAAPPSPAAVPANQYWYYCTDPAGYYPYVQNCSKAWMQVVPQLRSRRAATRADAMIDSRRTL